MNQSQLQSQSEQLAIELDENGMVVLRDPELLELVSGANSGGPLIGENEGCGWKMM